MVTNGIQMKGETEYNSEEDKRVSKIITEDQK